MHGAGTAGQVRDAGSAGNRLTGQGRQIKIKFVVFPAFGRNRAPDPVVYFAGGPGGSAIDAIPEQMPSLIGLNQDRDLVFIDQRGTGGSNGLNCPSPPETLADPSLVRRSIQSCLDSLRGLMQAGIYGRWLPVWLPRIRCR